MRTMLIALLVSVFAAVAPASTNVVTNGTSALILPMEIARPMDVIAPTGRVETVGSIVKEGVVVRQLTVNGWEVCPRSRGLVIVQKLSTGGTAVVGDSTGALVHLTDAVPAVVLTAPHVSPSPIWVTAEGADVTVFYSQR